MSHHVKEKILELISTIIEGINYIKNKNEKTNGLILSDIKLGIQTIKQTLINSLSEKDFQSYNEVLKDIEKLFDLISIDKNSHDIFLRNLNELERLIKELEILLRKESSNQKINKSRKIKNNNLKKVLIIAYYFPPLSGSGVQRTLKFVKYIRQFNWEPVIVTVDPTTSNSYFIDSSLEKEVPSNTKVIRIKEKKQVYINEINEIIKLYQEMLVDNTQLVEQYVAEINKTKTLQLVPDSQIFFAYEALKKLDGLVDFNDIDIIYSTSGPYSDHIIGYFLKKKYNKPWVVDFRDEWSNNPYFNFDPNNIYHNINLALERSIVHFADKVINVSPLSTMNYERIFQVENSKLETITNGYDEMDFINLKNINKKDKNYFSLFHNGLFYMIRTPEPIINAIYNLISSGKINEQKIRVDLGWTEKKDFWEQYILDRNLEDVIFFGGYLNHNKSLEKAQKMDALILVVGPGEKNKVMIPGKFFEYLRLQKPILSLSPNDGVVAELITELNRGINVDFNDVEALEEAILKLYNDWESGKNYNYELTSDIIRFERKNLTKSLTEVFNELL